MSTKTGSRKREAENEAPSGERAPKRVLFSSPSTGVRSAGFGLPLELVAQARDRLRVVLWLSLFATSMSLTVRLARVLVADHPLRLEALGIASMVIGGSSTALCLGLLRLKQDIPGFALRLGLVFEIVLGYVLAVGATAEEALRYGHPPHLTWAAPLSILFPLIVPSRPRTTLLVAMATNSSSFAGVAVASSFGLLHAVGATYVEVGISAVIATAVAYFGAKVVHGLNRDYAAATRAGSYFLKEKLGAGGMGEVWRAEHQFLARPAAVKVIRPDRLDAASDQARCVQERFRREAKAAALLRSPHTIEIYDYGVTDDGSFFYVMELLEGLDLDCLVREHGPLPPERVIHILLQVTCSLAEAHEHAIIHRDIKPANIYVCHQGFVTDFVKVLDFGLVKMDEDAGENAIHLTAEETIQGTPAFMSPEQISKADAITPASDIYSLGCVAYWLLTGRLPFMASSTLEMMLHHLTTQPGLPSEATNRRIPEALDSLVKDCLSKRPEARPQSMRGLHERLTLVTLDEAWSHTRAGDWWAQHVPRFSRSVSMPFEAVAS